VSTSPPPVELADHVTFGHGAVATLPSLIEELRAERVLLVCGRRSFEASGAAAVLPAIEAVAEVHRWSDFRPNTDAEDLAAGLALLREVRPDTVLGIGGGSAMDMAKLLCGYGGLHSDRPVTAVIEEGARVEERPLHLVLVPTTSGSGAETTHFSVVYVGAEKHSIAGAALLPDRVVLDPSLTLSGSAYQRATSGVDAVAQAIESLWATGATERSRRFAGQALPLLLTHLEPFVNRPSAAHAAGMSLGSHLAGRAIDISKTTASHALSYGITKGYGLSHGHAVATTLGPLIETHALAGPDRLQGGVAPAQHAAAMRHVLEALGADDASDGRRRFDALCASIGLDLRLSAVGLDTVERCRHLASTVNVERLGNNPVVLDGPALESLLRASG
jgi:alcohol dehydrogenase